MIVVVHIKIKLLLKLLFAFCYLINLNKIIMISIISIIHLKKLWIFTLREIKINT